MDRTFSGLVAVESYRHEKHSDFQHSWTDNSLDAITIENDSLYFDAENTKNDSCQIKHSTPLAKRASKTWQNIRQLFSEIKVKKKEENMNTNQVKDSIDPDQNCNVTGLGDSGYSFSTDKMSSSPSEHNSKSDDEFDIIDEHSETLYLTAIDDDQKDLFGLSYDGCDGHPNSAKIFYCTDCQEALCVTCKVQGHSKHNYTTLESAAIQRRGSLRRGCINLQDTSEQIHKTLDEVKDRKQNCIKKQHEVSEKLRNHRNQLHKMVDAWYQRASFQLDTTCSQQMADLEATITNLQVQIEDIEDTIEHTEQLLVYDRPNDILSLSKENYAQIQNLQDQCDDNNLKDLLLLFRPNAHLSNSSFGTLTAVFLPVTERVQSHVSENHLVSSFSTRQDLTNTHMATGLSLTDTGNLIVTDVGADSVKIFKKDGTRLITFNTLPTDYPVKAIQIGNIGEMCQYIVASETGLKLFDHRGNFGKKVPLALSCSQALALTPDNQIITGESSDHGTVLHVLEPTSWEVRHSIVGGLRAPIFTSPWYATVNKQGNILLTDRNEHCVKIITQRGMLLCEFGRKGAGPGHFFHPAGICVDQAGHILVADCYNNRVQMFSIQGEFLGIILDEEDVSFPADLLVNKQGHLVVLQGDGHVKTFRYVRH